MRRSGSQTTTSSSAWMVTTAGPTWTSMAPAWPALDRLYCLAVAVVERLLMGPGPSNPYPEVMQALVRPVVGHLDPEFLAVLDETCDRLRRVFRTANALTLPVRSEEHRLNSSH